MGGVILTGLNLLVALAVTLLITGALVVIHEWLHGLAMRRYGGRPRHRAGFLGRAFPYLACSGEDYRFHRFAFPVIALTPLIVLTVIRTLGIWLLSFGGWLVVLASMHFGGCIGDVWMSGLVLKRSHSDPFEDTGTGPPLPQRDRVVIPD